MRSSSIFVTLVSHFLKQEFAAKERLITPILFGAAVILLFAFTIPEPPPEWRVQMFVAQGLISSFFVLQIALARAFDTEGQDRVFDMIRVSPISGIAFICAKLTQVVIVSGAALALTTVLATLSQGRGYDSLATPLVFGLGLLMLLGLSSLGVLLAAITLKANARQVLFPILYFPLTTPVLIASSEFLTRFLQKPVWDDTNRGWFVILAAFDAIYLTLAILLGAEAISEES